MTEAAVQVVLLILALQFKHLLADFFLQNDFMLAGRNTYLHPGRALHAAIHGFGTVIVMVLFGTGLTLLAAIAVVEIVVHFHIDWGKARLTENRGLTAKDRAFWFLTGIDQALHQATYLAIALVWLRALPVA